MLIIIFRDLDNYLKQFNYHAYPTYKRLLEDGKEISTSYPKFQDVLNPSDLQRFFIEF
jgi:hypothetical protein